MGADRVGNGKKEDGWSSSGSLTEPSFLKATVAIGNQTKTLARTTLSGIEATADFGPFAGGVGIDIRPAFRSRSWNHTWSCFLGSCVSELQFDVFWIDERDGSTITWDVIELGAQASDQPVTEGDVSSREFYRYLQNTADAAIDWKKDGHDPDFNVGFKLWKAGIWWFWQASSHA